MSATIFKTEDMVPPDVQFDVTRRFLACDSAEKINLGQGTYRDENGQPWVLPAVKMAKEALGNFNHEYLPILGLQAFRDEATKLLFNGTRALEEKRDMEENGTHLDPGAEEIEAAHNSLNYRIDPDEERAVVRKLDMVIMPMLALVYLFQYIDKQSISQIAIFGLREDLNLNGLQFSWAVALFYLGQLVAEIPCIWLLSRLPITLYVGVTIVFWGAVNIGMGGVTSWEGLAATRFFLGFAEGAVSPAFVIITSLYYKRREHPIRTAFWLSMSGTSQIVGALMMYGIARGNWSLAPWRSFLYIAGTITSLLGVAFIFVMPRDTKTAWFLNERERHIAVQRLALDRGTREKTHFDYEQARDAFLTPSTWIYFLWALCLALTTPILKFNATVINGFGYDKYTTMLVGLPGGAINICTVWAGALIPRFFPNARAYTAMSLSMVPLTGAILLISLPKGYEWGIVVGTWMGACSGCLVAAGSNMIASNVKGNTKKSVVTTGFFMAFCVGCIVSPQAWTEADAPRYIKGCVLSIAALVVNTISYAIYRFVRAKRENEKRDPLLAAGHAEYSPDYVEQTSDGQDLDVESDKTDVQDKGFRYIL